MVVLAAALWAIQLVAVQLECADAARTAARAAARGEPLSRVRELAQAATSPNARVDITTDESTTKIEISVEVTPSWSSLTLPPVTITSSATTPTEH
ncbi:hypothetical protein OIE66_38720 [Nonomuraea sp. NBC_01738]|nr:hypothetical protein OIE66_38720 [Nonomuraea sp. NBC_01738]